MHLTADNERQRRSVVVVDDVGARNTACCRDVGIREGARERENERKRPRDTPRGAGRARHKLVSLFG